MLTYTEKQFLLWEKEMIIINEWDKTHKCQFRLPDGSHPTSALGGRLSVIFTPTSVGNVVEVECSCGQSLVVRQLY